MSDEPWILVAIGVGAVALPTAILLWQRRGVSLLGPVFWYELVALARRGQQPRLRGLLAGLLLAGLLIAYLSEFPNQAASALAGDVPLTQSKSSSFAHAFMVVVLVVQLVVVLLITPALVAGAIAEEKEHGTLDFLRSSLLTNREIVFGKLMARLVFVGGVAFAGLPVLALTMLFGAVDVSQLFGGYLITTMTALSLGAYSLFAAVQRDTLRDALVQVYLVLGALTLAGSCCSCIPGVAAISPPSALGYILLYDKALPSEPLFWIHLAAVTGLHGLAALLFALLAVIRIRTSPQRARPRPRVEQPWFRDDEPVHEPTRRARRSFDVPRLGNADPLLWKELHFSGRLTTGDGFLYGCGIAGMTTGLFFVGLVLFFSMLAELNRGRWIGEALNPPARLFLTAGTLFVGIALGVRAAGAVARERERQTLDALLMLPFPRGELLLAKWMAQFVWARYWLIALAIVAGTATALAGIHPLGMIEGLVQIAGWLLLMTSLGLWLSVSCRTVTQATVYLLLTLVALVFGPLVLTPLAEAFWPWHGRLVRDLSLPVGVWQSLTGWEEFMDSDRRFYSQEEGHAVRVAAGLLYGGLAALFWLAARRRFEGVTQPDRFA